MIQLFANNINLTTLIQQTVDVVETPRKIYGNNGGMSTSGLEFEDLITTKYDPSFRLKPLPVSDLQTVINLMENATVTLRYTSAKAGGALRSITAAPLGVTAHYATDSYGRMIYDGEILAFRQLS